VRKWRVGTVSMGILLIATGLLLLISELKGLDGAKMILRWWPVILIILGIEILVYLKVAKFSGEEQPKLKFDGLSIFLTIFIILVSSGVYAVSSFLNSGFSSGVLNEFGLFENETVVNQKYDISATGVDKLKISNSQGKILVESTDGDKILIDAVITIRNNDEKDAEKLAQSLVEISEGETLAVNTRGAAVLKGNNHYQVSVDYAVKVPKELTYEINNSFGEITVRDLNGNVNVRGEFGKIEVARLTGDAVIRNSFGETVASDIAGRVEIINQSGEISYSSSQEAQQDIILRAEMGTINLKLPDSQQGTFKADTELGDISLEGFASSLAVDTGNTGQQLEGTISKDSPVITLHANQGSIHLQGS